jgi:hypothetical protein
VHVATGTPITIKIGSNATVGQQGAHWITNPSAAGIYTVAVGGTFGGSGNMLVSINSGVTVAATVAESLAFTASSVYAVNCTADDGATVNSVTSTATSVPFGTISPNTFYQGCQDLIVSTNAGGGYSLTVQESSVMKTANGQFTIPDTTCDAGCTSASSGTWVTPTKNGLGHTCANQVGSDCAGAYSNGTKFRPFANVAAGINGTGFVQGNIFRQGSITNISVTLSSNVTANNIIAAEVSYDNTITLTSITAPCVTGNFTLVDTVAGTSRNTQAYAVISGSGSCTVTGNLSGTTNANLAVQEIAGINSSNPLDKHAMQKQVGPGTGTDAVTSGNVTTTANGDYIFGVTFDDAGTNPTFTAGTGFTSRVTLPVSGGLSMEDKIQSTAGSVAATFTSSGGNDTITGIMAFNASPQTGEMIMASSTPATATGRIKFRLSAGAAQPAGTYTTIITYTIYAAY